MDLHVTWYGDAAMTKNVTVENNTFEAPPTAVLLDRSKRLCEPPAP